jgi:urate oxidase
MYEPKFHSLNDGNTLDHGTLNQGKQCVILYGAMAGITKNECKMWESLRSRNHFKSSVQVQAQQNYAVWFTVQFKALLLIPSKESSFGSYLTHVHTTIPTVFPLSDVV